MTKQEFLLELQRTLNGRIGSSAAAPHVAYYQDYIELEVRRGRKEEEVIQELGSPRLIGKNIGDALERSNRKTPYVEKAVEYGSSLLKHGLAAGRKCAGFGAETLKKAKGWLGRL